MWKEEANQHNLWDQFGLCDLFVGLSLQVTETLVCTIFTSGSIKNTRSTRGNTMASRKPQSRNPSWFLGLLRSCGSRSSWGGRRWGPRGEKCGDQRWPNCLIQTDRITRSLCVPFPSSLKVSLPAPCTPVLLVLLLRWWLFTMTQKMMKTTTTMMMMSPLCLWNSIGPGWVSFKHSFHLLWWSHSYSWGWRFILSNNPIHHFNWNLTFYLEREISIAFISYNLSHSRTCRKTITEH